MRKFTFTRDMKYILTCHRKPVGASYWDFLPASHPCVFLHPQIAIVLCSGHSDLRQQLFHLVRRSLRLIFFPTFVSPPLEVG
jgi:hypothetical protein